MAPTLRPCFIVLLLYLHLCSHTSMVCGGESHGATLTVTSSAQTHVCSESTVPSNSWKVAHRSGPCVPNGDARMDIDQIYRQESLRAAYLQNQIRLSKKAENTITDPLQASLRRVILPARDGFVFSGGSYIVTVAIGTPVKPQTVIFDTGSSTFWVQCMPCHPCFPQREPTFDPRQSRTYRPVPCDDPACTHLPEEYRGCVNNTCTYRFMYDDGSRSAGVLAKDTLALTTSGNEFPEFVFGCGHENQASFYGAAGVLGLSRSFHSLATQTSSAYGNVFSYCLPSTHTSVGYLTLGDSQAPNPSYTPMLHNENLPGLYFLELTGISVDNLRLVIPVAVFRSVGTIIDSGVTISRIPPAAYTELRTAFRRGMRRHGHQELHVGVHTMDTCYEIGRPNFAYPHITLHFNGTSIPLSFAQVFERPNPTGTKYCLGFAPSPHGDVSVLGSTQQRGMEVIYDIGENKIGFYRGSRCP